MAPILSINNYLFIWERCVIGYWTRFVGEDMAMVITFDRTF